MLKASLLEILNELLKKKNTQLDKFRPNLSLRKDLDLDSYDLAELTVRIEDRFGIDIFEESLVDTLAEIYEKLSRSKT